jgi:cell wall-associated NlpC family hydrolase
MHHNSLYSIAFSMVLAGCAGAPPKAPVQAQREPAPWNATQPRPDPATQAQRAEALLQALFALGIEYNYGGRSPDQGFDCSGLVAHVFREAYGIHLPHNARAQAEHGSPVSMSELEPGDLVFYNTLNRPFSHVGIYLGDSRFVHAPKAGASVRVESIRTGYWSSRFDGARRINPPI